MDTRPINNRLLLPQSALDIAPSVLFLLCSTIFPPLQTPYSYET